MNNSLPKLALATTPTQPLQPVAVHRMINKATGQLQYRMDLDNGKEPTSSDYWHDGIAFFGTYSVTHNNTPLFELRHRLTGCQLLTIDQEESLCKVNSQQYELLGIPLRVPLSGTPVFCLKKDTSEAPVYTMSSARAMLTSAGMDSISIGPCHSTVRKFRHGCLEYD